MLDGILIFILFLGPLVFFHELGHFLFARLAGVRVEVFSIGFGPKLFKFKRGDTQYAVSLIPLGGYVKMFGDDPLSEVELTDDEKKVAYTHKGKWARFWIVFGGPLANFILAFVIYFFLVLGGEKVPQTRFGVIPAESFFASQGVKTGDVLKTINTQEITSFDDLNLVDSEISKISVNRVGENIEIPLEMTGMKFIEEFSKYNNLFRSPVLVNSKKEQFLLRHINAKEGEVYSLEEYQAVGIKNFTLTKIAKEIEGNAFDLEKVELDNSNVVNISVGADSTIVEELKEKGFYPIDLLIDSILMSSAAEEAKLKSGDILVSIDGKSLRSFEQLRTKVTSLKEGTSVSLEVVNASGSRTLDLTPELKEYDGKKIMSIGISSSIILVPVKMIDVKSKGLFDSIVKAWTRTEEGFVKTLLGFKKLITGEVDLNQIGGPLAIGKVASDSFYISLSMFFRLMALISINLGIINLFPIPVLDGGHIVFIILEAIKGGPLSKKNLQYAQQIGLVFLFSLIFFALYNDATRFF